MMTRTMLALALLTAFGASAGAQVSTLIEDARWSPAAAETSVAVDLSQRKTLEVPELPAAPAIDGRLDDPAWQAAAQTDVWMVVTGETPAPVQTTAWVGVHQGTFYLGFRAEEPNPATIVASVTEPGGPVWNDDCIELFVDGNLDLQAARQLVVNSLGVVTALQQRGEWAPEVLAAVQVGQDAWTGEVALSLADLGITGTEFGLNICRERRAGGGLELSCWSPTGGAFNQPGRFGLAALPGGWLKGVGLGTAVLGQNELTATIANPTGAERRPRVRLVWWQGDGMPLERILGPFTLAAGASREVTIGYDVRSGVEPVGLEVSILDEVGRALATREATQEVTDALSLQVNRRVLREDERALTIRATLRLSAAWLERSRLVLAVFDEAMVLEAREVIATQDTVLRAELELPPLEPGAHSLHLVLKAGEGDDAPRIAEERVTLEVLPALPPR